MALLRSSKSYGLLFLCYLTASFLHYTKAISNLYSLLFIQENLKLHL